MASPPASSSTIRRRLETTDGAEADPTLLTQRAREVLETLVRERLPELELAAIKEESSRPKDPEKPDGKQVLDVLAYLAALKARLIEAEPVGNRDLDDLAVARVGAIQAAMLSHGCVTADRLLTDEARETVKVTENGWVPLKLELDARAIASDQSDPNG